MRRLKIIFMIILSISYITPALSKEKIDIVTFEYPGFMNKPTIDNKENGFAIELVTAAFKKVDIEVSFKFKPLARSILSLDKGKYSVMLGTLRQYSTEAQKHLIGVQCSNIQFLFYYLKNKYGEIKYKNVSELSKYKIGNIRGSSSNKILKKAGIEPELVSNLQQNFEKLIRGRIDFLVSAELTANKIIKEKFNLYKDNIMTLNKPLTELPIHLIFRKDKTKSLSDKFKKGLNMIKSDGSYSKIAKSYYGSVVPPEVMLKY